MKNLKLVADNILVQRAVDTNKKQQFVTPGGGIDAPLFVVTHVGPEASLDESAVDNGSDIVGSKVLLMNAPQPFVFESEQYYQIKPDNVLAVVEDKS